MYLSMYPYQIRIEFCAEISLTFSQEKLTSSMELVEMELKLRVGRLDYVHAQGQHLIPAASLERAADAEIASSVGWEYHLWAPPGLMLD